MSYHNLCMVVLCCLQYSLILNFIYVLRNSTVSYFYLSHGSDHFLFIPLYGERLNTIAYIIMLFVSDNQYYRSSPRKRSREKSLFDLRYSRVRLHRVVPTAIDTSHNYLPSIENQFIVRIFVHNSVKSFELLINTRRQSSQ